MTTDASRDVREGVAEDDAADAGRPSLADWLVVSVRPSQMPPPAPSVAEEIPQPSPETEASHASVSSFVGGEADSTSTIESHAETESETEPLPATALPAIDDGHETASSADGETDSSVASDEGNAPPPDVAGVDPYFDSDSDSDSDSDLDDSDLDASRSLTPQIFSERDPGAEPDPDLDEALAVVLLSPAARARRAALVRGAFFLLGAALVLFFLGRWFVRRHPPLQMAASTTANAPLPPPVLGASLAPPEPEETLAYEEEPAEPEQSLPSGLESTGRVRRSPPQDSTGAAPIVAPAWSVARFPDLPRDVLIACEQAALQAHSAKPPEEPNPPPAAP